MVAPTLSIPVSDLTPPSGNDIKAVPVVVVFPRWPMSTSRISLPCSHSSRLLRLPEEGLREQECSETPQHHFPKQPTSVRQVTVPDSDPRDLETPTPLPI